MADQVITVQKLIDADKDATSLDTFISGTDTATVTTRKGRTYPSLAKAVKQVMETGGFEPFETEVQLLASIPTVEKKAAKALDTKKVWYWDGAKWNDTGLSEYDLAKQYINNKLKETSDENVFEVLDLFENIVLKIKKDGGLYIPDLQESVQSHIKNLVRSLFNSDNPNDLFVLKDMLENVVLSIDKDANISIAGIWNSLKEATGQAFPDDHNLYCFIDNLKNVYAKFDNKGHLHLVDVYPSSVQDKFNSDVLKPVAYISSRLNSAELTENAFKAHMSRIIMQPGISAPVPLGSVPTQLDIDLTKLSQLTTTQNTAITVNTFLQNDDRVVHPYAVEFKGGFRGYHYWLGLTPFSNTDDSHENAIVMGSNDLLNFNMIEGFPQPFAFRPTPDFSKKHLPGHMYNSDDFIFYDHNSGELCVGWRPVYGYRTTQDNDVNYENYIEYRRTLDGYNWSPIERLTISIDMYQDSMLAPSLIYDFDEKVWRLYAVKMLGAGSWNDCVIQYRESKTLGNWGEPVNIPIPSSIRPWHIDVRYVGNKVVMLINDYTKSKNLYFAYSNDGQSFITSEIPILTGDFIAPYKASFLPVIKNQTYSMKIFWSSNGLQEDKSKNWNLFINETNEVEI